jgi:hypothetical protein
MHGPTDRFVHTLAGHCGSGALRDLLGFHALDYGSGPLSEGFVFGLGGGLGFLYVEVEDQFAPAYVVGRTGSMEQDIARHLGIGLDIRESDDPDEGWRWVREAVDADNPPMVWADIAELDYLRVRMTNTRHDIVVVGYDDDAAWIADNDREELQRCSLTSLARARNSTGFPGANRHRTFLYDWPAQLAPASDVIAAGMRTAVANMRSGGGALGTLDGGTGLAGVDAFAASYPTWPQRFDGRLEAALAGLRALIVKAGTGGAMFRSLHAEFLHDAATLLASDELAALARDADALSALWVRLAERAQAGDHAGGVPLVGEIQEREHAGVAGLERWLATA